IFVTQFFMLSLASIRLMGTGLSVWPHVSFGQMTWMMFHHLVLGHGLWYGPIWGWLLLCSAWSKRAPLLWATLPPLAIGLLEKIAFHTSYFGTWLMLRFAGGPAPSDDHRVMTLSSVTQPALEVFASSGLWLGLLFTAAMLVAAVQVRRSRGPL